jgi:hypothetical protein
MALVLDPTQARVILHGITWSTFERLLEDRGDSAGLRLTYDQGTVELAMPSPEPEWLKGTLTQIVDAIAFARDLHYQNFRLMRICSKLPSSAMSVGNPSAQLSCNS